MFHKDYNPHLDDYRSKVILDGAYTPGQGTTKAAESIEINKYLQARGNFKKSTRPPVIKPANGRLDSKKKEDTKKEEKMTKEA